MKARPFLADRIRQGPVPQYNDRQVLHANLYGDNPASALSGGQIANHTGAYYSTNKNGIHGSYRQPFYSPGRSPKASDEHIQGGGDVNRHDVAAEIASKSRTYPHRGVPARRSYNNISRSPVLGPNLRNEPHVDSFYQSQYKARQQQQGQNYAGNDLLDQISGAGRASGYKKGLLSPMQGQGASDSSTNDNGVPFHINGQSKGNSGAARNFLTQSRSDSTIANSAYPHSALRQRQENGYGFANGSSSSGFRSASSCDEMEGRSSSKLSVSSSIPPSPSSASSTSSFLSNRLPYSSRTPYDNFNSDRLFPVAAHLNTAMPSPYDSGPAVTVQERYYNGSAPGTPDAGNAFDRRGAHRRPIHASAHSDSGGYKDALNRSMDAQLSPRTFQRGMSTSVSFNDGTASASHLQVHNDSVDGSETNSFQGTRSASFDTVESVSPDVNTSKQSTTLARQEGPADVAAKLFTLNGYKDSDVAPLMGKNTDFSQNVCREYLKFFDFRGLALDEALRLFLKKFPLTGETQERERILVHFSRRHFDCNNPPYGSEDAIHTLTCSLMLLNSDLHGHNIGNKMTLQEFINNLSGLCDGGDFPKDLLKSLYQSIKTRPMEWLSAREAKDYAKMSPRMRRKNSAPGNPFVELKVDDNAVVMKEGLMYRKCVMDADGKRTPAIRRGWKLFYGILRGLVLFLYKADHVSCDYPLTIGIHHALAGYANDYKKRPFVFKLITADWRVFLFQSKSKIDVQEWIDGINVSAAVLSSPPLPAPCSSSKHFQRPVMPVATTRLPISEQLKRHENQRKEVDDEVEVHRSLQPKPSAKEYKDWESKMDYLEFSLKRFSSYVHVLTTERLKQGVDVLVASRVRAAAGVTKTTTLTTDTPMTMATPPGFEAGKRSNSVGDFSTLRQSPPNQRKNSKQRQSYLMAVYP